MVQGLSVALQLKVHLDGFISTDEAVTQTYCFTAPVTDSFIQALRDDFLYELVIRLINNLEDQVKINAIKSHADRCKSLLNKLFTRAVLNYFTFAIGHEPHYQPWSTIRFEYNKYGKPFIKGVPLLQFSSSTSNNMLCIVVQTGNMALPLGVDLSHLCQPAVSETLFMEQFDPLFHPKEKSLMAMAKHDGYFTFNYLWTVKEAFTKLLGCGLNCETSTFYPQLKDASEWLRAEKNKYNVSHTCEGWISKLNVSWFTNALIKYDGFDPSLYPALLLNQLVHPRSTVLQPATETALPVILTIVMQNHHEILCAQVDITSIVLAAVE